MYLGRRELLDWLAESFNIHYDRVEKCASGAAYCQILDAVFRSLFLLPVASIQFLLPATHPLARPHSLFLSL